MAEYAGFLAVLQVDLGAGYINVAQVVDLSGPSVESDQIEVSHRDDRFRRYVAGMRDGGEVTFDVIFDPDHASHDPVQSGSMYSMAADGSVGDFRIVFPGVAGATTTATFNAFVSNFEVTAPLEDGLGADLTLKITGEPVWAHVP